MRAKIKARLEAAYKAGSRNERINPELCEDADKWVTEHYPRVRDEARDELIEEYCGGFYSEPPSYEKTADYLEIVRGALGALDDGTNDAATLLRIKTILEEAALTRDSIGRPIRLKWPRPFTRAAE